MNQNTIVVLRYVPVKLFNVSDMMWRIMTREPLSYLTFMNYEGHIMGWATYAREALARGETVQVRPRGHSMTGRIDDGDMVTLAPCDPGVLQIGDAVLVRVHGNMLLHLIKTIQGDRFLIGN